jgi:hypothetical protein
MPLPRSILDEQVRRGDEEHHAAERDRRRDAVLTAVLCLAWSVLGIALLLTSFHMTSDFARVVYYAGLGGANAGIIFTLLAWYRRGEKRGDW